MPYGTTPSRWRVYQFHHQGNIASLAATHRESHPAYRFPLTAYRFPLPAYRLPLTAYRLPLTASHFPAPLPNSDKMTGPTGLEPATSRVTVECSNQAELRPQLLESGSETPSSLRTFLVTEPVVNQPAE